MKVSQVTAQCVNQLNEFEKGFEHLSRHMVLLDKMLSRHTQNFEVNELDTKGQKKNKLNMLDSLEHNKNDLLYAHKANMQALHHLLNQYETNIDKLMSTDLNQENNITDFKEITNYPRTKQAVMELYKTLKDNHVDVPVDKDVKGKKEQPVYIEDEKILAFKQLLKDRL